jgi:hypothetical protein
MQYYVGSPAAAPVGLNAAGKRPCGKLANEDCGRRCTPTKRVNTNGTAARTLHPHDEPCDSEARSHTPVIRFRIWRYNAKTNQRVA